MFESGIDGRRLGAQVCKNKADKITLKKDLITLSESGPRARPVWSEPKSCCEICYSSTKIPLVFQPLKRSGVWRSSLLWVIVPVNGATCYTKATGISVLQWTSFPFKFNGLSTCVCGSGCVHSRSNSLLIMSTPYNIVNILKPRTSSEITIDIIRHTISTLLFVKIAALNHI